MEPDKYETKRSLRANTAAYIVVHVLLSAGVIWAFHVKNYGWAEVGAYVLIAFGPVVLAFGYFEAKYTYQRGEPVFAAFPALLIVAAVFGLWHWLH